LVFSYLKSKALDLGELTKRQRRGIYCWIRDLAIAISQGSGKDRILPAAWQEAAKQWLLKNRMIRIRKAGKVLPNFPLDLCHN
jgi:hypothetical protein